MKGRRYILILAGAALLLWAWGGAGHSGIEDQVFLQALAVDGTGETVTLRAATADDGQQPEVSFAGTGPSLGAACQAARSAGAVTPTFAQTEELLVGEGLARQGLDGLLDYVERDVELRLSTRLWLLRGEADRLDDAAQAALGDRLAALTARAGRAGNAPARTAGDLLAAQDRSGCGFLPALTLTQSGELVPAGYGVLRDQVLVGWLEGDAALGAGLILGTLEDSLVDLTLPDGGQVSVRIGETACRVGSDGDAALTLRCSLRGTAAQLPAGWTGTAEERQTLQDALARWAEDCLTQCAVQCRSLGADPLELARRAGLTGTAEEMQVRVTARAVVEE